MIHFQRPTNYNDSTELEKLKQENQQLRDEIHQLNEKLDDLQQIIIE